MRTEVAVTYSLVHEHGNPLAILAEVVQVRYRGTGLPCAARVECEEG